MWNSRLHQRRWCAQLGALLVFVTCPVAAQALPAAQGFDLERLYPSASGGGWFVMDDLNLHGGLGGSVELTTSYARDPLLLSQGGQHLAVVSNEVLADVSAAVSYDRFRLYIDFPMPLLVSGESGTLGGYSFAAPVVNPGSNPDSITDVRIGFDVRLLGLPGEAFRLGLGAQLIVPSNAPTDTQANYLTDGTVRAMFRALFAGDIGAYRYAAQVGVHVRPLNESPEIGAPEGSELLFGVAAGRAFNAGNWAFIVGPEVYGETAFASFLGTNTSGVEGLLTGRLEGTGTGPQLRFKLGLGGGIDPQFGTPEWRVVLAVELFSGPSK